MHIQKYIYSAVLVNGEKNLADPKPKTQIKMKKKGEG
jgi:hypothetical protein